MYWCFLCFMLNQQQGFTAIFVNSKELILENKVMRQVLSYSDGSIRPTSIFDKTTGRELLVADASSTWFSFAANGQLLTGNNPIWKFSSGRVRKLNNGGEEVELVFKSVQKIKGLQLKIYRQLFPNSTIVRERMVLGGVGTAVRLMKWNNELHFTFPVYTLRRHTGVAYAEEIRIATFDKEGIEGFNTAGTQDDRLLDSVGDFNLAQCHMFHPERNKYNPLPGVPLLLKGPIAMVAIEEGIWFTAYEHASQDKGWSIDTAAAGPAGGSGILTDANQGVSGTGQGTSDNDVWFLGIGISSNRQSIQVAHQVVKGAYLDGESFTAARPYETAWAATAFAVDSTAIQREMHSYLLSFITEKKGPRNIHFYYNTWGMQRDKNNTVGLRKIFTEKRMLQEIDNAADLNVDLFVLDDGWEEAMGDWQPNKKRLPNGLKPLVEAMKKRGMTPGIWLSPMGIDSLAERYRQHPEWVIKDDKEVPIKGQWDYPVFDFVSGFKNLFVADCKRLIDQGIRFFKWDAINTFNSSVANLYHGSSKYTAAEIRDRYAYLLPFYVTAAMRELREYNSDIEIEIDLTEKERCMVGLITLQEGKFFWMNNGASGYNDYSSYRTKSMRTVINKYSGVLPNDLFTQAVYPHNTYPFFAQRYNVNTGLIGGRGFWGNLSLMSDAQRVRVGKTVAKARLVLPYIAGIEPEITGSIGTSPEAYTQLNKQKAAGQIIAFSGSAGAFTVKAGLQADSCLGVLNHIYSIDHNSLSLPFQFNRPDDSREAFVLPNKNTAITITSTTAWLDDIRLDEKTKQLTIVPGAKGTLTIRLPHRFVLEPAAFIQPALALQPGFTYYTIMLKDTQAIVLKWKEK